MHVLPSSSTRLPFLARSGWDAMQPIAAGMVLSLAVAGWSRLPSEALLSYRSLSLLVLAPTLEEVVFRGGLQEGLLRCFGDSRSRMANLLTATAFTAAHVAMRPTVASLLTVLPALAIGLIYQRGRRIAPCIAVHIVFNGIWLLWVGLSAST